MNFCSCKFISKLYVKVQAQKCKFWVILWEFQKSFKSVYLHINIDFTIGFVNSQQLIKIVILNKNEWVWI